MGVTPKTRFPVEPGGHALDAMHHVPEPSSYVILDWAGCAPLRLPVSGQSMATGEPLGTASCRLSIMACRVPDNQMLSILPISLPSARATVFTAKPGSEEPYAHLLRWVQGC
jgi:hypothetical protein